MQLAHVSRGNGDQRQVHVLRPGVGNNVSPPLPQGPAMHMDPSRRVLNRAATTDFSDARGQDPVSYGPLRGHQSSGLLGIPDSPSAFTNQNLRAAKSFADLRSYSPSPAQSSASFPAGLQTRFHEAVASAANGTPTLTPTASQALGQQSNESLLVNGLGNLAIGTSIGTGGSPRRLRPVFSWDDNQGSASTAPIGSNRNFGMNTYEDSTIRERGSGNQILPSRQPRGPAAERGQNFARGRQQNGHQARGSDELRQQSSSVEIIVE